MHSQPRVAVRLQGEKWVHICTIRKFLREFAYFTRFPAFQSNLISADERYLLYNIVFRISWKMKLLLTGGAMHLFGTVGIVTSRRRRKKFQNALHWQYKNHETSWNLLPHAKIWRIIFWYCPCDRVFGIKFSLKYVHTLILAFTVHILKLIGFQILDFRPFGINIYVDRNVRRIILRYAIPNFRSARRIGSVSFASRFISDERNYHSRLYVLLQIIFRVQLLLLR